jgi:hypothetical protein
MERASRPSSRNGTAGWRRTARVGPARKTACRSSIQPSPLPRCRLKPLVQPPLSPPNSLPRQPKPASPRHPGSHPCSESISPLSRHPRPGPYRPSRPQQRPSSLRNLEPHRGPPSVRKQKSHLQLRSNPAQQRSPRPMSRARCQTRCSPPALPPQSRCRLPRWKLRRNRNRWSKRRNQISSQRDDLLRRSPLTASDRLAPKRRPYRPSMPATRPSTSSARLPNRPM